MASINAFQLGLLILASLLTACARQTNSPSQHAVTVQLLGYGVSKDGRKLARLRIQNGSDVPIKFSGYNETSEFEVADRFSDSYRVERGNGNWVSVTPVDVVDGFAPPSIFTVPPASFAVISVAAQKAPTEPYKICPTATETTIEICTDVLREKVES